MASFGGCLEVDSLPTTVFNDVCVVSNFLQNITAYTLAQNALNTCCGPDNFFIVGECYTYCNITTPYDTVLLSVCLIDNLDEATSDSLDFDCYPFAWELSSTTDTQAGKIATTWTFPDQTITFTATNSAVSIETLDYQGNTVTASPAAVATVTGKTTSASGSTASRTTTSTNPTSTAAIPTPSKSASQEGSGIRFSYGTAILVALSVWGLVL
jgi:hypothetical protein